MTDKEFVCNIYPGAHFTRGNILNNQGVVLWEENYGLWAEEWNDTVAIDNAWKELAAFIQYKFLKKLES